MLMFLLLMIQTAGAAEFSRACESGEQWKIELARSSTWTKRFDVFLTRQESPWLAFSEAIQLKKMSRLMKHGEFEAQFSEYWVGRVFFDLELYPLALTFFKSTVENSRFPELKKAANACLSRIYRKIPDWNSGPKGVGKELTSENADLKSGLNEIQSRDYAAGIKHLKKYLAEGQGMKASVDEDYRDTVQLLLGRSLYSIGRFNEAIEVFQKIDKRSNLQIDVLNDLAWAYLLSERYPEALGVALQLRSGALKNTFTPESVMVAAMALNESCLYPDAGRMIKTFVHDYSPTFEWLIEKHPGLDPYREILSGLKNQSKVPAKVRSEWMKSSFFMTRQAEINLLIQNSRKIATMPAGVRSFQQDLARRNVTLVKKLIQDLKKTPLDKVDPELAKRLIAAKKEIRRMVRFNHAGKVLLLAVKKYERTLPAERVKLVLKINRDSIARNRDMLALLKRVRENIDLVEIEVYNGASREMVRAQGKKDERPDSAPQFETTLAWNWGRFPVSEIERTEIWEDEMGALKANISSHCQ